MIALIITLVSIAAYLGIGFAATRYTVPRGIKRSLDHNRKQFHYEDNARTWALNAGKMWRAFTVTVWPVAIPLTAVRSIYTIKPIEEFSPWYAEEQAELKEKEFLQKQLEMAEREAKVKKLERELGIRTEDDYG